MTAAALRCPFNTLFLSGVIALALCQAVAAQEISARVKWYGVYTVSKSRAFYDPMSPTGRRYKSTPEPPSANTDHVPGKDGLHFGLGFVLSGPAKARITLRKLYRFPPGGMPDLVGGGARSTFTRVQRAEVGKPLLMGWSFLDSRPEQILIGDWTFEVWRGKRKLVEQTFTVFSP